MKKAKRKSKKLNKKSQKKSSKKSVSKKKSKQKVNSRKVKSFDIIGLAIDYSSTLNELALPQLHEFYSKHYTPIKELCAVHNEASAYNSSKCEIIIQLVDAKIDLMNAWLHAELDKVRAKKVK